VIKEIYIKGKVRAKYIGISSGSNAELLRKYQDIVFSEIWVEQAEEISGYNNKLLTKEPYYELAEVKDVFIKWAKGDENTIFQEDVFNVVMNEIQIIRSANGNEKGEFIADFYGTYRYFIPDPKPVDTLKPVIKRVNTVKTDSGTIPPPLPPEPTVFDKPWQPDDFLNNFNVSRESWDGWRQRWQQHWLKLFLIIFFLFMIINSGLLKIPFMWLVFFYLIKKAGDSLTQIFAPKLVQQQIQSVNPTNSGRQFLRFLYGGLLFVVMIFFFKNKLNIFGFAALVFFLIHLYTYKSPFFYAIRRVFQGLALLLLLFAGLRFVDFDTDNRPSPVVTNDDDEELIPDTPDSSKKANQYTISWNDYQNRNYKGSYNITKNNYSISYSNRNKITNPDSWGTVYENCFSKDQILLPALYQMFDKLKSQKRPDEKQFAEMVGAFVQRIPYVLVHDQTCEELMRAAPNDEFIQEYHREGKQCLQNCKYGLQAPAEFGFNLKGDCDTRALLAYTILDHYGYNVAMLTSDVYGHAILGIGLPYQGLYKSYKGVRYYTWELTAKDWQPGLLAPQLSEMSNWEISNINN
jgi:hypothetical protein